MVVSRSLFLASVLMLAGTGGAKAQYMSMFNAYNSMAVNFAGTVALNSAVAKSAEIAARKVDAPQDLAPARAARYQPIRYKVDPAIRRKVMQSYLDRAAKVDAGDAAALTRAFTEQDQFAIAAGNFRHYGLNIGDLGDVVTAYWAVNWGAVHGTGRPSRKQVAGLQKQIHKALAGSSLGGKENGAKVQYYADDMMMRLLLIDGAIEQGLREGNPQQIKSVGSYVRQSTLAQMGFDLGRLNLTARGFVPR